jgi:hypothetical protein
MKMPAAIIAVSLALGATAAYADSPAQSADKKQEEIQRELLKDGQKAREKSLKNEQELEREVTKDAQKAERKILDPVTNDDAVKEMQENEREAQKAVQKSERKALENADEAQRERLKDAQKAD